MITLYSMILTVAVYLLTRKLASWYSSPLTNPVFLSTLIIIPCLAASHVTYHEYTPAKNIMTFLLGPATVSLALPIYKNREFFRKYMGAAIVGMCFGIFTTVFSAIFLGKWLHLSRLVILSFSIKSVTVPVAAEMGKILHGNVSFIAAVVIITGMIGAMFGLKFLSLIKVNHPFARGLSIGTISHGIGTAEAVKEGEIQGAVSGAAMGISAVLISFIIPNIIHYFL